MLLALFAAAYAATWAAERRRARGRSGAAEPSGEGARPGSGHLAIGFVTNFFDTLGIGSFAPTTAVYKVGRLVPDERIPGTLNVGHTLPVVVQAFLYISIIDVEPRTLVLLIGASIVGAWFGAGRVARLPARPIRVGMGVALLAAAGLMTMTQLALFPAGGDALGLDGGPLLVAALGSAAFGALNTIGVGFYAPCLILISLLGMSPRAAFPIMMGACAFLMPVASTRFVRAGKYSPGPAVGLTLGGIPGVLLAALLVKSLPLEAVRWLVVVVVVLTAAMMLRSAWSDSAGSG